MTRFGRQALHNRHIGHHVHYGIPFTVGTARGWAWTLGKEEKRCRSAVRVPGARRWCTQVHAVPPAVGEIGESHHRSGHTVCVFHESIGPGRERTHPMRFIVLFIDPSQGWCMLSRDCYAMQWRFCSWLDDWAHGEPLDVPCVGILEPCDRQRRWNMSSLPSS